MLCNTVPQYTTLAFWAKCWQTQDDFCSAARGNKHPVICPVELNVVTPTPAAAVVYHLTCWELWGAAAACQRSHNIKTDSEYRPRVTWDHLSHFWCLLGGHLQGELWSPRANERGLSRRHSGHFTIPNHIKDSVRTQLKCNVSKVIRQPVHCTPQFKQRGQ